MIIAVECVVLCLIFTLIVVPPTLKNPMIQIHNFPPAIIQRVKELGLISKDQEPMSKRVILMKIGVSLGLCLLLAVVLKYVNGAESFFEAFAIGYFLWSVVDWYDAIVIDIIWCCHDKRLRIKGTEDMAEAYEDYWFHIKMTLIGMIIGLPVCLLAAALVAVM